MGGKPILKDELIEGSLVILSLDHKTHCHGPEKLQSVQNLAVTTLIILLIFSGGFLWGEFKKVSKLDLDDSTLNAVLIDGGPIYTTGNTEVGKNYFNLNVSVVIFWIENDRSGLNEHKNKMERFHSFICLDKKLAIIFNNR